MCGIAGFYGSHHVLDAAQLLLRQMIGAITHRGPDAQGFLVDGHAALGHARLSIIDLTQGGQPMATADGSVWLTFNGEIFNYLELRRDLVVRGRRFRTNSDTEVILQLYEEFGADCVERLNGDFAFALWDRKHNRLMLARDRMGVRPLYYATGKAGLFFASEVKALLCVPGIAAEIDPVALDQIFTLWCPLAPRTPFIGISELPPAHVLIATGDQTIVRPYWKLEFPDDVDTALGRNEGAIAEELRELLTDAVRIRLRSDVPVGAYLSGGLDSSIVAAIAKTIVPAQLRTFSVTFESTEFDESAHQQAMTAALGTDHDSTLCTTAEIARIFPAVIRHTERPILRTAPAPLFALSRLVHDKGFKVVLTGEGADEVFAGYDLFKEASIRRFCARQPQSRFRPALLRRLYSYLPGLQGQSQKYLESFFGRDLDQTEDLLFSHLPRFRTTASTKIFFSQDLRQSLRGYDALAELRDRLPLSFGRWHPLSQAQYLETSYLLPGYILSSQGDRVAMANTVEGRFPFLDHRVVEFAARIPPSLKLRGLREKHILRQTMQALMPPNIGSRSKQPYRAPDAESFTGASMPAYVGDCLSGAEIKAAGYFNADAVEKLAAKNRRQALTGFRDNAAFVGILSTQLCHREFVRGAEMATPAKALAQAS